MIGRRHLLLAAFALALAAPQPAPAASGSAAGSPPRHTPEAIAAQAKTIERTLAAAGARVAIVGRIGRDPATLPKGLTYTHVAFWMHSTIRTREGELLHGYAVHNLYQRDGEPDRSELVQDFPADFLSPAFDLKVAVLIPKPELQARLGALISSPAYAALHNPRYSVVANPLRDRYQNCTSFVLDVVMAALYRTEDRRQIRANVQAYFQPQIVEVGGGRRLFASLFVPDVATSDHDERIHTATMEALADFMMSQGLAERSFEVAADGRIQPIGAGR
ncbi:DUF2145 domain-containing protein [Desertibaculum subflavum]|uniref:DUF2145 domain-containing protein n=1 Tax=Desertibaculum subflavum TaxID=2268458 RepID=UPI000E660724